MPNSLKITVIACVLQLIFATLNGQDVRIKISEYNNKLKTANQREQVLLLDSLSRAYWEIWPDSSLVFSIEALEIAQKLNNDFLLGEAYNSLGNAFSIIGETEKALTNYQKSKRHREKTGNKLSVALSLYNIALTYHEAFRYTESINAFKEAADICEQIEDFNSQAIMHIGLAETYKTIHESNKALENAIKAANTYIHYKDKRGLASVYIFIGGLHSDLNNQSLALEYYLKAHEFYTELNDESGISATLNNIGMVYGEMNNLDKALEYYNASLLLAQKIGKKKGIATAYNNIGYSNSKLRNYGQALEYYKKSLLISIELRDLPSIMNTNNNIAWIELKTGNIDGALNYVNQAIKLKERVSNTLYFAESHEILSEIMERKGKLKEALQHKKQLLQLKDSLYNRERNQKLLETQMRFETERKDREIELLKKDNAINELLIQKQRNLQTFLLLSIVLLIAFSLVFYSSMRTKKLANKQLSRSNELLENANKKLKQSEKNLKEINATKDKFFSIIAHDIKNPFSAIMGFGEILHKNYDNFNDKEKKKYIKIIFESSVNLYKLLENLLHWSKSQLGTMAIKPELVPIMPLITSELQGFEHIAQNKGIKMNLRVDSHLMAYVDKNSVAIIIRNLLGNAIKFTNENGKVSITAEEKENSIHISISDSGIGLSQQELDNLFTLNNNFTKRGTANEEGSGLGLILCKDLTEKNEGTIQAHSTLNEGSTFTIVLPTNRWK